MKNLKNIGYLCLTVVLFLEVGSVIGNLSEGYPLFYLFDFSERFSVDNPTFFLYWGSVIGMVFVIREFDKDKFFNLIDRDKSPKVENEDENSGDLEPSSSPQENTSVIFKKTLKDKNLDPSLFEDLEPSSSPQEDMSVIFKKFLKDKNLSYDEFHKNPPLWIEEYKKWLKEHNH